MASATVVYKGNSNEYPQPNFNPKKEQPIAWSEFPRKTLLRQLEHYN